jgi:hypothetical protein
MRFSCAAGVFALSLLAGIATAQEPVRHQHHSVNISTNREGRIAYYAAPSASCGKNAAVEISILERPSYGRIILRPDRLLAYAATIPARAGNCRGQFVDVTAVFYKPAAGFHGTDRAVLRLHFPGAENGKTETRTDEIYISVR